MQTNTEIGYNSKIEGDVIVTRRDAALNWFRKGWMRARIGAARIRFAHADGLACCAIELMAAGASRSTSRASAPKSCAFLPANPT